MIEKRELTDIEMQIVADAQKSQQAVLNKLQDHLNSSGCKFVTGDCLCLADYVLFSELQDTKYTSMDMSNFPRLMKYQDDVMEASLTFKTMLTSEQWFTILPALQNGVFKLS